MLVPKILSRMVGVLLVAVALTTVSATAQPAAAQQEKTLVVVNNTGENVFVRIVHGSGDSSGFSIKADGRPKRLRFVRPLDNERVMIVYKAEMRGSTCCFVATPVRVLALGTYVPESFQTAETVAFIERDQRDIVFTTRSEAAEKGGDEVRRALEEQIEDEPSGA